MCEPKRRKRWDDVTIAGWIPAALCTKLDIFARKLNLDRRQALEIVLCAVLAADEFLRELLSTLLFKER